jgi:Family of unknown function (DUF5362)
MIDQIETEDSSSLSIQSKAFLSETAGWAKFLGIVGFVFIGLMILLGFFAGSMMSAFGGTGLPGAFFTIFYIVFALLYFFPCYYLVKFSSNMKQALQFQSRELLDSALENLKSFFKYLGIFTIVILAIYALALVFGGLGAMF